MYKNHVQEYLFYVFFENALDYEKRKFNQRKIRYKQIIYSRNLELSME